MCCLLYDVDVLDDDNASSLLLMIMYHVVVVDVVVCFVAAFFMMMNAVRGTSVIVSPLIDTLDDPINNPARDKSSYLCANLELQTAVNFNERR